MRQVHHVHLQPAALIAKATMEVRSAIVYATVIIVLVLVPLFFLPGMEGRLILPLAIAYIVSLLASMLVSVTLTPVMAYYLLPGMKQLDHGDPEAVALDQGALRVLAQLGTGSPKVAAGGGRAVCASRSRDRAVLRQDVPAAIQ